MLSLSTLHLLFYVICRQSMILLCIYVCLCECVYACVYVGVHAFFSVFFMSACGTKRFMSEHSSYFVFMYCTDTGGRKVNKQQMEHILRIIHGEELHNKGL